MDISEFNLIYDRIKEHKDEIFIKVDRKKIIETYKNDPEELLKKLKAIKNYIDIKDIKKICGVECKNNIISFILNNFKF